MNKPAENGSRLFFIEFLIVLFFFLIISTVCLRLFASAHGITLRADALSHARTTSASIAEIIAAGDGTPESVAAYLPAAVVSEQELTVTYDSSFEVCDADETYYTLTVVFSSESADAGNTADAEDAAIAGDSADAEDAATAGNSADAGDAADAGHSKSAQITVTERNGGILYELSVFCHTPITRGEVLS